MEQLNKELLILAKKLPSTDASIEALALISNAIDNVTNEAFKVATIIYIKRTFKEYIGA